MDQSSKYIEESIKHIEDLKHVRARPGMYFGSLQPDYSNQLIGVLLDNCAIDAFLGLCSQINLTLSDDHVITIVDNSPGLPVDFYPPKGMSKLEIIMTRPAAIRESFDLANYRLDHGIMGVGIAAVNALSAWMVVEVKRDGFLWRQHYTQGKPQTPVEQVRPLNESEGTGSYFQFQPDLTIMSSVPISYRKIARRCFEIAYLIPDLQVILYDDRAGINREATYFAPHTARTFLEERLLYRMPLHTVIHARNRIEIEHRYKITIEFTLAFTTRQSPFIAGYVNTESTASGGEHCNGIQDAIMQVLCELVSNVEKRSQIAQGVIGIISVHHPTPQFESQTRIRLLNPEIYEAVFQVVTETLRQRQAEWLPQVMAHVGLRK